MTDKTSSASQPTERFLFFSEEARSKASISEGGIAVGHDGSNFEDGMPLLLE